MIDFFDELLLVIAIISSYTFVVSFLNLISFSKPKPLKPKSEELISIMVPCRNEEDNIDDCVESLVNQDYDNIEILLIDDNSTDNTLNKIKFLSSKYSNVSAIKGEILPKEWAGKNWACHQLSKLSKGSYLLFIDADTRLGQYAVSSGIREIQENNLEFLTLIPKRKILNFTDYLIWIMVSFFILCWVPMLIAKKLPYSLFAAGFGQFLLFNKEAYIKIGGHEKIKGLVLDDFELARSIKTFGFSASVLDGTSIVETKGYKSSIEAVDGHAKSIFATFRYNILFFIFAFFGLLILFYLPFLNLFSYFLGIELQSNFLTLSLLSIACIFGSIFISSKSFSLSFFSSFLYPFAMIVLLFSAYRSFLSSFDGDLKWKGRSTPSVGLRKLYSIIFAPFFFINWILKKIR